MTEKTKNHRMIYVIPSHFHDGVLICSMYEKEMSIVFDTRLQYLSFHGEQKKIKYPTNSSISFVYIFSIYLFLFLIHMYYVNFIAINLVSPFFKVMTFILSWNTRSSFRTIFLVSIITTTPPIVNCYFIGTMIVV